MTAEAEMRNVMLHAADRLAAGLTATKRLALYSNGGACTDVGPPTQSIVAMAYGEGVLRLLASYLAVEDKPRVQVGQRDDRGRFISGGAA